MFGFVNFQKSPRHVELSTMGVLADRVRGKAQIVVLTVNATDAQLTVLNDVVKPDWWQLHGHEDAARVAAVQSLYGRPVMKALGIGTAQDVMLAKEFAGTADKVLLDAKPPKDATRPGGLGAVFDWSLLDGMSDTPSGGSAFMLSGGLNPTNVAQALQATHVGGVDVSSGVESAPGVKDATLIEQFIAAARSADQAALASHVRTSA